MSYLVFQYSYKFNMVCNDKYNYNKQYVNNQRSCCDGDGSCMKTVYCQKTRRFLAQFLYGPQNIYD